VKASKTRVLAAWAAGIAAAAWAAIVAAAPAPPEDIRDIRPLILIPLWWYWLAVGLVAVVVLAAVVVAYRLWRQRSAGPLTPVQRARVALAKAESLAREGRCREWGDVVAETLRTALSARLGHDAGPQTTSELASVAWIQPPLDAAVDVPRLLELLSSCDLTRFAMGRLDANSLVASTDAAREWVTRLFAPEPSPSPHPQVAR
jgi:hypothetical protein